jgi:hypothetical protein
MAKGWMTEGSEFESRQGKEFSLLHVVQTGSGAHPASYKMGNGGSFLRSKSGRGVMLKTPPTSAEVKKLWIYTSTRPHVFMV